MRKHPQSRNRRTMVVRVMELLVDSGVLYTAIWASHEAACPDIYLTLYIAIILYQLLPSDHIPGSDRRDRWDD